MQRVAAYCRVSTDQEDQAGSLASQEKYFREYIDRRPDWDLAEIYVDLGKTGTSTKKRAAFNQMLEDAMSHKLDLILTKEISRFARNTLDSIYYTRKLRELGIGVIFMNDNINTLDADAELRLTIMSSIAQEESRKTSDRVKWGQKRSMEQGVVFGRDLLGYDVRDGRLVVNEQGAEIVRCIFHKFVREGKGSHVIARELREAGIPTSTYMKQWSNTVILRILRNEKMCGDLIQKKTYTPSYLSHEKKYNKGQEELVVLRNHHRGIIDRELFDKAQRELERRSPAPELRTRHSNRYCFSGKIKCGICGSSFVARTKKRKDGSSNKSWRCYRATIYGGKCSEEKGELGCGSPSVKDEELKLLMRKIMVSLEMEDKLLLNYLGMLRLETLGYTQAEEEAKEKEEKLKSLMVKKQRLLELYLSQDISKQEFLSNREKYENNISQLKEASGKQEKRKELEVERAEGGKCGQTGAEDMSVFLKGILSGELWEDAFYKSLLERIIVSEDGSLSITLKSLASPWKAVRKCEI